MLSVEPSTCGADLQATNFWAPLGFEVGFEEDVALPDGSVEPYFALVCDKKV